MAMQADWQDERIEWWQSTTKRPPTREKAKREAPVDIWVGSGIVYSMLALLSLPFKIYTRRMCVLKVV